MGCPPDGSVAAPWEARPLALVRSKPSSATVGVASAMPLPAVAPAPHAIPVPRPSAPLLSPVPTNGGYLRRCTFRKVELAQAGTRRTDPMYAVTCLYPDRETGSPLGDLQSARAIRDGCAATGIFRPDED